MTQKVHPFLQNVFILLLNPLCYKMPNSHPFNVASIHFNIWLPKREDFFSKGNLIVNVLSWEIQPHPLSFFTLFSHCTWDTNAAVKWWKRKRRQHLQHSHILPRCTTKTPTVTNTVACSCFSSHLCLHVLVYLKLVFLYMRASGVAVGRTTHEMLTQDKPTFFSSQPLIIVVAKPQPWWIAKGLIWCHSLLSAPCRNVQLFI